MKNFVLGLVIALSFYSVTSNAQEKFTLSGIVSEEKSNETLIGVNIVFPEIGAGTTTNEYGFYSITLPKGTYSIVVSYLGYQTITETIELNDNISNNIGLAESLENLDEVIITKNIEKLNIKNPQMSVNTLTSQAP